MAVQGSGKRTGVMVGSASGPGTLYADAYMRLAVFIRLHENQIAWSEF